jgi:hypothetical protein
MPTNRTATKASTAQTTYVGGRVASINDRINSFFKEITTDGLEERVIEYIVREVHKGRRLMEVVDDPYVRNRFPAEKRDQIFNNPEIVDALESEIRESLTPPDLGFSS